MHYLYSKQKMNLKKEYPERISLLKEVDKDVFLVLKPESMSAKVAVEYIRADKVNEEIQKFKWLVDDLTEKLRADRIPRKNVSRKK